MRAIALLGALLLWPGCGASDERGGAPGAPAHAPAPATGPDEAEELAEGAAERAAHAQSRIFYGRGRETLGDLDLPTASRLDWTAEVPLRISIGNPRRTLRPRRGAGRLHLPAGTYRDLEVRGRGRWTFRVVPISDDEHEEHDE